MFLAEICHNALEFLAQRTQAHRQKDLRKTTKNTSGGGIDRLFLEKWANRWFYIESNLLDIFKE